MIFSAKILKTLMKRAYAGGGLTVGLDKMKVSPEAAAEEPAYIITGNNWAANINERFLPKEIKAVIMECAGEFPGMGEYFTAYKKQPTNYTLNEVYEEPVMRRIREDAVPFESSRLCIGARRITRVGFQELALLDTAYQALLSGEIDEENGETPVSSKLYSKGKFFFWNNTCAFCAYESTPKEEEEALLNKLKPVDIFDDVPEREAENGED